MLMIKAERTAGTHLKNGLLPDMLALAKKTGCSVEANGVRFWVYPKDTIEALNDAFDRLYPKSRVVSVFIKKPWPKDEDGGA